MSQVHSLQIGTQRSQSPERRLMKSGRWPPTRASLRRIAMDQVRSIYQPTGCRASPPLSSPTVNPARLSGCAVRLSNFSSSPGRSSVPRVLDVARRGTSVYHRRAGGPAVARNRLAAAPLETVDLANRSEPHAASGRSHSETSTASTIRHCASGVSATASPAVGFPRLLTTGSLRHHLLNPNMVAARAKRPAPPSLPQPQASERRNANSISNVGGQS